MMPLVFDMRRGFTAPAAGLLLALLSACSITPAWANQTPKPLHHPGKILYVAVPEGGTQAQIFAINPDGSDAVQLSNLAETPSSPAWSPDGSKIVFVSGHYDSEHFQEINEIYVMNADGTQLTPLTQFGDQQVNTPIWSPDGEHIAFEFYVGFAQSRIYVMNADGTDPHSISPEDTDDKAPSWSPDGQYIVYANIGGNSIDDLYVMRVDGSERTSLFTNNTLDRNPVWSPDGERIAWISHRDGYFGELYVMNADGRDIRRLTFTDDVDEGSPTWSPDGTQIAYHASVSGVGTDIRIINAAGGESRLLVADATFPAW